jgi:hypothetical protein
LQQLREVWTKNFKSSAAEEDDVQEDDVEMTVEGGASSVGAPAEEDAFEKQMRLSNEATTEQLRASTTPRYVKPQTLDQLEEGMQELRSLRHERAFECREFVFIDIREKRPNGRIRIYLIYLIYLNF